MRTSAPRSSPEDDVYSADEIARAAGVPVARVTSQVRRFDVAPQGGRRLLRESDLRPLYFSRRDAIWLVRALRGTEVFSTDFRRSGTEVRAGTFVPLDRLPLTMLTPTRRRQGVPLVLSGTLHAAFVLVLVLVTSGIFASETEQQIAEPRPVRLVYFMALGPGGGGGGGGLKMPMLPARAERRAPRVRKADSPVPPVRKAPPPPRAIEPPNPVEPPKIDPPKIDPAKVEPPKQEPPRPPPQTVQAPVASIAADTANKPGVLNQPPAVVASAGPGTGGGVGTGIGTGMGEGMGTGIGPGSGGGIGGGPFQPGTGINPPMLLREIKPLYTDEARRRSIEGDVELEIVVRRDGSVGNLRVIRRLGAGLDEKAVEAVRQWRFAPARRRGAPIDVIVEVSVEFTLR